MANADAINVDIPTREQLEASVQPFGGRWASSCRRSRKFVLRGVSSDLFDREADSGQLTLRRRPVGLWANANPERLGP
jgi:hypothetical protein